MLRAAFTVEERDHIRTRLLEMAHADARVVAGAIVGSMARGGGDRWSDLDLTFGLAPPAKPAGILDEWTPALEREFGALRLFDLPFRTSLYRVFLFPGSLQVDVSFTPAAEFGALGPGFELLFGEAAQVPQLPPPAARHLLGLAVHHAVRARICIERGRAWQAEYWITSLRAETLAIAATRIGLPASHARGADALPAAILERAAGALVRSLDRVELMRALGAAIETLLAEASDVPDLGGRIADPLRALTAREWPGSHPDFRNAPR